MWHFQGSSFISRIFLDEGQRKALPEQRKGSFAAQIDFPYHYDKGPSPTNVYLL